MFAESGVETGVDLPTLLEAGRRIRDLLGLEEHSPPRSPAGRRRTSSSAARSCRASSTKGRGQVLHTNISAAGSATRASLMCL